MLHRASLLCCLYRYSLNWSFTCSLLYQYVHLVVFMIIWILFRLAKANSSLKLTFCYSGATRDRVFDTFSFRSLIKEALLLQSFLTLTLPWIFEPGLYRRERAEFGIHRRQCNNNGTRQCSILSHSRKLTPYNFVETYHNFLRFYMIWTQPNFLYHF